MFYTNIKPNGGVLAHFRFILKKISAGYIVLPCEDDIFCFPQVKRKICYTKHFRFEMAVEAGW